MNVTLKNIGTLKDATFDLSKDLIIFIGPNNTGKTYAAYTIYALHRFVFQNELSILRVDTLLESASQKELLETGTITINIWDLFLANEPSYSQEFSNEVTGFLYNAFDVNKDFFRASSVLIKFQHVHTKKSLLLTTIERTIRYGPYVVKFEKSENSLNLSITIISDKEISQKKELIDFILPDLLTDLIFQSVFSTVYIAPAERIAINLFSKQLSVQRNKLVDDLLSYQASMIEPSGTTGQNNRGDILSRARLYPLPIRDSLELAERLIEYRKQESEFSYLANLFESDILQGKVSISEYGEVLYTPSTTLVDDIAHHKIEIISAKYGINDTFIDVTKTLSKLGSTLHKKKVTNKLMGSDPVPNQVKQVLLDWTINDLPYSVVIQENGYIDLLNDTKTLGIHLSASMVKSLSSLVFYFRHIAQKGDFIIIDEPELNLHPDNQRKVAKLFSRVVNAGFKLMISTHSDYFIRELNNLIMLGKEHPETAALREKHGYHESETLDYKRVGTYLFKNSKAITLEVTESGMEAATIDEEINKLNNTATDIYWTLFEN